MPQTEDTAPPDPPLAATDEELASAYLDLREQGLEHHEIVEQLARWVLDSLLERQ